MNINIRKNETLWAPPWLHKDLNECNLRLTQQQQKKNHISSLGTDNRILCGEQRGPDWNLNVTHIAPNLWEKYLFGINKLLCTRLSLDYDTTLQWVLSLRGNHRQPSRQNKSGLCKPGKQWICWNVFFFIFFFYVVTFIKVQFSISCVTKLWWEFGFKAASDISLCHR